MSKYVYLTAIPGSQTKAEIYLFRIFNSMQQTYSSDEIGICFFVNTIINMNILGKAFYHQIERKKMNKVSSIEILLWFYFNKEYKRTALYKSSI